MARAAHASQSANQNYRVESEAGILVARVCRAQPLLGIDRRSEAAAQRVAARLGLAPELIHHEEGLLVSRHLAGRTLAAADLQDLGLIAHVGEALRRLHSARDAVTGHLVDFCPFQTIRTYARSAAELGARLPEGIDELLKDARIPVRRIGPFLPALCHNDLLPANLIWSDGRLWLIDWEYAGMGHPPGRFPFGVARILVVSYIHGSRWIAREEPRIRIRAWKPTCL